MKTQVRKDGKERRSATPIWNWKCGCDVYQLFIGQCGGTFSGNKSYTTWLSSVFFYEIWTWTVQLEIFSRTAMEWNKLPPSVLWEKCNIQCFESKATPHSLRSNRVQYKRVFTLLQLVEMKQANRQQLDCFVCGPRYWFSFEFKSFPSIHIHLSG